MADTAASLDSFAVVCHLLEDFEFALCLYDLCFAVSVTDSDSGRVVASVFKL